MIKILNKEDKLLDDISNYKELKKFLGISEFNQAIGYFIENKIIGHIMYSKIYDNIDIFDVFVEPLHRKQKIGCRLLSFIIENISHDNITLEVNINNIPAINLYKKCGFEQASIRKGYYKGVDGILMIRCK